MLALISAILILVNATMALILTGCANMTGAYYADGKDNAFAYIYDPDGDGDAKGWNYFPEQRPAMGRRQFIFDPSYSAWALYDANGMRLNTGRASGGKGYCPDINRSCRTITGRFRVLSKGGAECKSTIYPIETGGGAPMPYCMRFSSKGYAVHGSYDVPNYNASHGCIRVTPTAARWLSDYMGIGTSVMILSY